MNLSHVNSKSPYFHTVTIKGTEIDITLIAPFIYFFFSRAF